MAGGWLRLRTDCGNGKQRSRGLHRFLRLLRGGRAVVAGLIAGDRTAGGKRPEQQGRVGGPRQRVEAAAVAGEAAMRAGSRGGGGLRGEDGKDSSEAGDWQRQEGNDAAEQWRKKVAMRGWSSSRGGCGWKDVATIVVEEEREMVAGG
ncbi:hypothetical protein BHE74_00049728 [Ensete ventricosum]|nr:hypothetical protein BHE74_00049728 [Ensete ventricosum]